MTDDGRVVIGKRILDPTFAVLESFLDRYVCVDHPDGTGGCGRVIEVWEDPDLAIIVDWGWTFTFPPGTVIYETVEEEGEGRVQS